MLKGLKTSMYSNHEVGDFVKVKITHIPHINHRDALVIKVIPKLDMCQVLVRHQPILLRGQEKRSSGVYLVESDCLRRQGRKLKLPK